MKKEKMPWAVKQQCIWIIRDYDRVRRAYLAARREIIEASGSHFTEYVVNGERRLAIMPGTHTARRTTEDRQLALEALEYVPTFKQMHAVEHAREKIGLELPVMLRDALREAILLNCKNGRAYPFERLYVVGISRTDFYRFRDDMLRSIAAELGLWRAE